jgi:hypothetical protein
MAKKSASKTVKEVVATPTETPKAPKPVCVCAACKAMEAVKPAQVIK